MALYIRLQVHKIHLSLAESFPGRLGPHLSDLCRPDVMWVDILMAGLTKYVGRETVGRVNRLSEAKDDIRSISTRQISEA